MTPADRVRELVEIVADALDLDGEVDVRDDGETIIATLAGDDVARFIGRGGTTIDAVQHLAFKVAFAEAPPDRRVVVDAGGYRERRRTTLEREADAAAAEALETGRPVALEAMSAMERKLVHEHLKGRDGIETYSEGAEPDRHLVVAPAS